MFCPGCGIQTTEELKFCKNCGANLRSVRDAMASRIDRFDWGKTWVADIFLTEEERDRRRGISEEERAEKKRTDELKAGVITTLVGISVTLFLYFFFEPIGRKAGGNNGEIIHRLWLAGVVQLFVGIGILFNALFLSKRGLKHREQKWEMPQVSGSYENPAKTTSQLVISDGSSYPEFSVAENTTAHLPERREALVEGQKPD